MSSFIHGGRYLQYASCFPVGCLQWGCSSWRWGAYRSWVLLQLTLKPPRHPRDGGRGTRSKLSARNRRLALSVCLQCKQDYGGTKMELCQGVLMPGPAAAAQGSSSPPHKLRLGALAERKPSRGCPWAGAGHQPGSPSDGRRGL